MKKSKKKEEKKGFEHLVFTVGFYAFSSTIALHGVTWRYMASHNCFGIINP
jgi:hypothetical protein